MLDPGLQQFILDIEDAAILETGSVSALTRVSELGLDSLGRVGVLALVDEKYGVELAADELDLPVTVQAFYESIEARRVPGHV